MSFRLNNIIVIIFLVTLLYLPGMGNDFDNNPDLTGNLIKVDVNSF